MCYKNLYITQNLYMYIYTHTDYIIDIHHYATTHACVYIDTHS